MKKKKKKELKQKNLKKLLTCFNKQLNFMVILVSILSHSLLVSPSKLLIKTKPFVVYELLFFCLVNKEEDQVWSQVYCCPKQSIYSLKKVVVSKTAKNNYDNYNLVK